MTESARPSKNFSLPAGFRYAGVACGIKPSGNRDLSLIVCDAPAVAVGVYTQNQVVAAPVVLCRDRTPSLSTRAVVTNSGNANSCTGLAGMENAHQMCRQVASLVDCRQDDVLVMSTGVIGTQLPMGAVQAGISDAHAKLDVSAEAFEHSADAILTTDKSRKTVCRTVVCGDQAYSIAAMAKGAGMIAPNMATMLAVLTTDAPLSVDRARQVLLRATTRSFNRVSVDGHTSTNDSYLLLSTGNGQPLAGDALETFQQHVDDVSIELAKMMVADGEGASHVMAIEVRGAEDDAAALAVAETVASSPLVKTAITGGDPNWGRIICAAGYAPARVEPARMSLRICGTPIYIDGSPVDFDEAELSRAMNQSVEIPIELIVGGGPGTTKYWSSDLTVEYVRFNSEYTT